MLIQPGLRARLLRVRIRISWDGRSALMVMVVSSATDRSNPAEEAIAALLSAADNAPQLVHRGTEHAEPAEQKQRNKDCLDGFRRYIHAQVSNVSGGSE